ncbi:MAG: hypothetical protein ABI628_01625 [Chloroflexota bacterium]
MIRSRSLAGRPRILATVLAIAALAVACSSGAAVTPPTGGFTPAPATSEMPGASASATIPNSPVAGVVTSVDAVALDQVRGFKLTSAGGQELMFVMGTLENGDEFPPGHLKEHMASSTPVLVSFRQEKGALVVYRIEDAP